MLFPLSITLSELPVLYLKRVWVCHTPVALPLPPAVDSSSDHAAVLPVVSPSGKRTLVEYSDSLKNKQSRAEVPGQFLVSSWLPHSILMKVLSGYTVTKALADGNMEPVDLPSNGNGKEISMVHQLCNTRRVPIVDTGNGRNRWRSLFLQIRKKNAMPPDSLGASKTLLFGRPLSSVCVDATTLPKPIKDILTQLLKKGRYTEGVFRKPTNARRLREIKEQLDSGEEVNMNELPVLLLAALLKDFLRNIPSGLLVVDHFPAWMTALESADTSETCRRLTTVLDSLPKSNVLLLQHLLCVLLHISKNSITNKMDAKNLAVCISPNLLQRDNVDMAEKVTSLTEFLIEHACEIFGDAMQTLLGDPDEEEHMDNLDSLSLHLQDSAYDSTDPDADNDLCVGMEGQSNSDHKNKLKEPLVRPAHRSPKTDHCTLNPFNRRCSEPIIYPSAGMKAHLVLARSHDDLEKEDLAAQLLRKQNSDDSFLLTSRRPHRHTSSQKLPELPAADRRVDSSYSSSCSLESSSSSVSEDSTFSSYHTVSPFGLPSSSRNRRLLSGACGEDGKGCGKEGKRRSQSMRSERKKLRHRWSLKKVHQNRQVEPEPEVQSQEDCREERQVSPRVRPRSLSTAEVFQLVDSRTPGDPPPYVQAVKSGAAPHLWPMTVQDARTLFVERKARPASVSEELLSPHPISCLLPTCHGQEEVTGDAPAVEAPPASFRQRAMSESVSKSRHVPLTHRMSQPLFVELLNTKESYV